ncbi:TetR/AcrR family transcriptional regulator [Pseudoalteromonas xiamenensis]|uniref:TetR/AcrR family transcriptional regulator n=1 Tax=Pseudoalteromonas xiamenensis TaxID=882626 RepID=A0A975DH76_9GAMM|nr:TetR/AcrR family transcriptional regulator [Pseudoalteromonas xiamenensis]QTH71672.1 TetR/AcrR family transcriptional regulator [Pseudoalteromonas xiamenensis]
MDKRLKTKERILDAAWQLFHDQGFCDTTTRQIATQSNVANGTVFTHYPNKGALLKEAFDKQACALIVEAKQSNKQHSPRLSLRHFASFLYPFYIAHRTLTKTYFSELILSGRSESCHLSLLEHEIHQGQPFLKSKVPLLIDLYVMTFVFSEVDKHDDVGNTLRLLSTKLQQIG